MSQDPLGLGAGDNNLYRYVGNRPTNATDPSGLEIHIDSIKIDTEGKGVGGFYPHLGWITGPQDFAFGFNVTVKATVKGEDDIRRKADVSQYIFSLGRYEQTTNWYYMVANKEHGAPAKQIDRETERKIMDGWKKDNVTFGEDLTMKQLANPDYIYCKIEKDTLVYTDVPGWGGRLPLPEKLEKTGRYKRPVLPAKNKLYVDLRLWVKVFAYAYDDKEKKMASFWVAGGAINKDDKWVMDWDKGPNPSLPKTW